MKRSLHRRYEVNTTEVNTHTGIAAHHNIIPKTNSWVYNYLLPCIPPTFQHCAYYQFLQQCHTDRHPPYNQFPPHATSNGSIQLKRQASKVWCCESACNGESPSSGITKNNLSQLITSPYSKHWNSPTVHYSQHPGTPQHWFPAGVKWWIAAEQNFRIQ